MKKKTLIIEGPNGMGKDVFINKILEYCSYYKVHYAASDIVNEVKDRPELLPLISYATFETIHTSIQRDPTDYPHIQYRSPLSNMVYNPIYRPDADWLKLDNLYVERFFTKKYDDSYVFWLAKYNKDYLLDQLENHSEELSIRLRNRKLELDNIVRINERYEQLFELIKDMQPKCKLIHTTGTGTLDYMHLIDAQINEANLRFSPYSVIVVDSNCIVGPNNVFVNNKIVNNRYNKARWIFIANDRKECLNRISSGRFGDVPSEDRFMIIVNPCPLIFNEDFFSIYVSRNVSCVHTELSFSLHI